MSDCRSSTYVTLLAGGLGGTVSAIVTCPLEVIKTRLQSSASAFTQPESELARQIINGSNKPKGAEITERRLGILGCGRHIIHTEGVRALYKGLGPNLIGVAPSRAIYFTVYAKSKRFCTDAGISRDSPIVHMCAGASAGFVTHTLTSPVWFIKTRLQLSSETKYGMWNCIRKTYREEGITGFYRGMSASYYGCIETMIHFVIYERLKHILRESRPKNKQERNNIFDFVFAAGFSKCFASIIAYPHEVARTRLRQETHLGPRKYRSFFQTLHTVWIEEGRFGLYGGLGTQLVRQVPNNAVMFVVYETFTYYICAEND